MNQTPQHLLEALGLTEADIYDLFFSRSHELQATVSFLRWFTQRLTQAATLLDVGCGTGRLLHPLRELGLQAFGVEPRQLYRERAAQFATVYDGDFSHLPQGLRWDLIFAINGPFIYITHWRERLRALSCCFEALHPEGWLLLDVPNFLYLLKNYQQPEWQVASKGEHEIRRRATHRFDYAKALWLHEERVEWRHPSSPAYQGYTEQYAFAIVSPQEIEMMLCSVGFTSIEFYPDWSARTPNDTGTQRILVAAKKPK